MLSINYSLEAITKVVSLNIGISFSSEISVKYEVDSGYLNQYLIKNLNLNRNFSLVYSNSRYISPIEEKSKEFVAVWNWIKLPFKKKLHEILI